MSENHQTPDFSAMIGQVLSNPEALKNIMQFASGLGGSAQANAAPSQEEQRPPHHSEEKPSFERPPYGDMRPPKQDCDCDCDCDCHPPKGSKPCSPVKDCDRVQLLRALKPFLCDERREKADAILRILGLISAAEKMGLTQNLGSLFGSKGL